MEVPITNGTSLTNEDNMENSNLTEILVKPRNEVAKPSKQFNTFSEMRSGFLEEITKYLSTGNVERLKQKWNSFQAKDITKRVSIEQAFKDKTVSILNNNKKSSYVEDLRKYIDAVMVLCKNEVITVLLFVSILSDIIDTSTLAVCEQLFDFVEENLSTWKSATFFSAGKNNILRMCNDLLRRLSKAQNTVFCGRILLFLAMFFPFSERSGLNIVSEFNSDTLFKSDDTPEGESVEIVDVSLKLDEAFYSKFWQLQEYFRNPNQCYNKSQWQDFIEITNLVFGIFKKHKLNRDSVERLSNHHESQFFTKFLTSPKLLVLQLSDSNFRRTICMQYLILFQYLTGQIKTKPENHELTPEGSEWIKEIIERIYAILKESPPDGEEFLLVAKNMILREEEWGGWKNEGCPALKKVMDSEVSRVSTVEDNLGQRSFSVLTAQAATGSDTIFVPSKSGPPQAMSLKHTFDEYISSLTPAPELKDFLAEAIEESERKMEPEKKKVADPSFAWLSVKLISLKAPTFFSNSHSAVPSMSEYVDIMCKKLYRDLNPGLLLPPYMPAPKSAVAKTKKPLAKTGTAGTLATTLKKRMKKPKTEDGVDKTVVKVVKGGVVKLIKTTKGIKVVKEEEGESVTAEPESLKPLEDKADKTDEDKPSDKQNAEKVTNASKPAAKTNSSGTEKPVVKKTEKPSEKTSDKSSDKTFVKPAPVKADKHKSDKSEKVSKSPSPKPQRKPDEKLRKDDRKDERRIDKRDEKKEDKKIEKREKRSRERSVETRKDKVTSDSRDTKSKTAVKSPGKRKASPKREDHKSNKVIRVEDDSDEDITRDQIHELAKSIASNWKKVAERLGYKPDEIEYFESEGSSDYNRAVNVLLIWVNDEEDATKDTLRRHLKNLGMTQAVAVLSK